MKLHATFREECIHTGSTNPLYDHMWGRYRSFERLNVDQTPSPFVVLGKRTYEYVPPRERCTHNTWISQPSADLDRRQCMHSPSYVYIRG